MHPDIGWSGYAAQSYRIQWADGIRWRRSSLPRRRARSVRALMAPGEVTEWWPGWGQLGSRRV